MMTCMFYTSYKPKWFKALYDKQISQENDYENVICWCWTFVCRAPYQNSLFWWQKYINTTGLLYHEDTLTFMSRHWNAKDGFNKGNIWNVDGNVFLLWMWKCQNKEWDDCGIWRGESVHLRVTHCINIYATIWADISRYSQVSGVSQAEQYYRYRILGIQFPYISQLGICYWYLDNPPLFGVRYGDWINSV